MSAMGPFENEQAGDDEIGEVEEEYKRAVHEQGARPFFSLLSFLLAVIFLTIFLTRPMDAITGLVVLFGVFIFGIGGILLLERKPRQASTLQPGTPAGFLMIEHDERAKDETEQIVDSTLIEVEEDAEEEEDVSDFERLVQEAVATIPEEFQQQMTNLAIIVEPEPGVEVLQRVGVKEGYSLLGLYQGVPLTASGREQTHLPECITIYQRNIEAYCHGDAEGIRQQVRSTVLHEVAHHFGMDHDEMPIWVK